MSQGPGMPVKKPKRNIYLKMKTLPEARKIWEGRTGMLRTAEEQVQAASSLGRVTSRPVISMRSVPHYHGAAMDGYAVRARDTYGASDTTPVRLTPLSAHPVDTGDPLPESADAVIMIEHVESVSHSEIEIRSAAFPGNTSAKWVKTSLRVSCFCHGSMFCGLPTQVPFWRQVF